MYEICSMAKQVLTEPDPWAKAHMTHEFIGKWKKTQEPLVGKADIPDRPARPEKPELRLPRDMPKRRKGGAVGTKIALLHALAHIELNAIDLAWDIMARFSPMSWQSVKDDEFELPKEFYDDWCQVVDDEAKHFLMLSDKLEELGSGYGALPAHDGLWQSAERTAHDFAARLAIVPMVLEARGLDVTPNMIKAMKDQGDNDTSEILQLIHDEEITHVAAGTRWFRYWCEYYNKDIQSAWQELVRTYFIGSLRGPFNNPSRLKAGMSLNWYEPLAEIMA